MRARACSCKRPWVALRGGYRFCAYCDRVPSVPVIPGKQDK